MNEQDFMKNINSQTKDIPIPDSISPKNMKRMLDEKANITYSAEYHADDTTATKSQATTKRNRTIRRFTVAACVTLCLAGGAAALHNTSDSIKLTSDIAVEESAAEAFETESKTEFGEDLVYQSGLQSPSSYDAYYNTLKDTYDAYYDSLATVTTDDAIYYEEAAAKEAETDFASVTRSMSGISSTADSEKTASKEFSKTNTQEKMVDEGDIIKTDGTYIYKIINRFNNDTGYINQSLTITQTDNGNLTALTSIDLSELAVPNDDTYLNFHEFYLYENYIILMYSNENYASAIPVTETNIIIYDIKDKENPKKIRTLTQSGWYESSRISDGFLYTISNFSDTNLDTPTPYTNYIPSVNGETIACENIYYPRDILLQTTYVITSLDLSNPKDFTDTKALPTNGGQTYVSDSSIYFYTTLYDEVTKTEITKVRYDKGAITPGESAMVAGYLYDSFALSEYDGHLRIVATIPANNISLLRLMDTAISKSNSDTISAGDVAIKEDVNVLYILDDNMKLTGKISGIAPGEQIYSARFLGDIGYFVTFRNVDPLFSVDLSDPANPTILGQLKIPGFSNYLHFYDENLLLGFGEEIDANTTEFLGLKLSMFDISDPANVTEQDKYIIENSEYSEAQYNHKAFMIDPEKNIFGFIYGYIDETSYENMYYYSTYTYNKENGFIETAKYPITDGSEYETDAVRGIYIGDYFYLATNKTLTSYEIGSTEPIAQVTLK